MSAPEIIEQIKVLPAKEQAQVTKFVVESDDSWVPKSFKQGMADAAEGNFCRHGNRLERGQTAALSGEMKYRFKPTHA